MRLLEEDSSAKLAPILWATQLLMDRHTSKNITIEAHQPFTQLRDFGQKELEAARRNKQARRNPFVQITERGVFKYYKMVMGNLAVVQNGAYCFHGRG